MFVVNKFIRKEYANPFLVLASIVFYAWGEPVRVLLMIVSILINWVCGLQLSKRTGISRKAWLCLAIIFDLLLLGYYKYASFLFREINALLNKNLLPPLNKSLPIGISFFTFQAISYVVDVYRGTAEASPHIVNTALYISFFPQLIAGPIVKYGDINLQIENRTENWLKTAEGFRRFIYGLAKKVIISNTLGLCADTVYTYDVTLIDPKTAWIGALAYAFQIYYDFSGYSDMAIGLGKMFGFDFLENFDYPYLSSSISEFWKRWHISLGTWFKEYLYIPLGGNREGKVRTYLNLTIVFLLTGLWHGADFSFILWGAYHGFFSIIERIGLKKIIGKNTVIGRLYCFLIVTFGWVLFRADRTVTAIRYLARMVRPWHYQATGIPSWNYLDMKTIFVFTISVFGAGIMQKLIPEQLKEKWQNSVLEAVFCTVLLILCVASIASDTYNPFIYFQF